MGNCSCINNNESKKAEMVLDQKRLKEIGKNNLLY